MITLKIRFVLKKLKIYIYIYISQMSGRAILMPGKALGLLEAHNFWKLLKEKFLPNKKVIKNNNK